MAWGSSARRCLWLACLISIIVAYGTAGGRVPHFDCFDGLLPTLRPVGSGVELASSFMLPAANYFATAPAPTQQHRIVIDVQERTLTLFENGRIVNTYRVAVGKPSTPTPVGEWTIVHKSYNWGGGFGTRWMGLNVPWGIYGIHGTNKPYSIGQSASAGCIRMFNGSVEELFELVPVGTPVDVIGPLPDLRVNRVLRPGTVGKDVQLLQRALRNIGLAAGRIDGRFGPQTQSALSQAEEFFGLEADGTADADILWLLNID